MADIKGYETKRKRCMKDGVPLRRTARQSGQTRLRKKLTASSSWFKIRKNREEYLTGEGWRKGRKKSKTTVVEKRIKQKSDSTWGCKTTEQDLEVHHSVLFEYLTEENLK